MALSPIWVTHQVQTHQGLEKKPWVSISGRGLTCSFAYLGGVSHNLLHIWEGSYLFFSNADFAFRREKTLLFCEVSSVLKTALRIEFFGVVYVRPKVKK